MKVAENPGISDEEWEAWPWCAVPGCGNKCCRALQSQYCWPHTPGTPEQAAQNLRETEFQPDVASVYGEEVGNES